MHVQVLQLLLREQIENILHTYMQSTCIKKVTYTFNLYCT